MCVCVCVWSDCMFIMRVWCWVVVDLSPVCRSYTFSESGIDFSTNCTRRSAHFNRRASPPIIEPSPPLSCLSQRGQLLTKAQTTTAESGRCGRTSPPRYRRLKDHWPLWQSSAHCCKNAAELRRPWKLHAHPLSLSQPWQVIMGWDDLYCVIVCVGGCSFLMQA